MLKTSSYSIEALKFIFIHDILLKITVDMLNNNS